MTVSDRSFVNAWKKGRPWFELRKIVIPHPETPQVQVKVKAMFCTGCEKHASCKCLPKGCLRSYYLWMEVVVVEICEGSLEDKVAHAVCLIIYYDSLETILT